MLFIFIYMLSVVLVYFETRVMHSKGGRYSCTEPDGSDIMMMLVPMLNTTWGIINIAHLLSDNIDDNNNRDGFSKIFGIKK